MIKHAKDWVLTKVFSRMLFLLLFASSTADAITLEKVVFQTLHTNPSIKEKAYNLSSVEQERDIVRAAYYPKLSISTGTGQAKEEITPAYREQGSQVIRTDSSITATMNLFNGFHTLHDSSAQKNRSSAANAHLQQTKSAIALQTLESFIVMMKHRSILQISQENVASHQEIYNKLKEKEKSGMSKASDLGFALGRLTLAQVNAVVHENNFLQSKVAFESVYGTAVEMAKLEEPIFDYTLPKTLEDAALIALDYNPSIHVDKYNHKSAQSNYKRSRFVYYPTVDLELKKSWFEETEGYEYSVDSSHAMVYLRYNLFNGFADKASVEKELKTYLQSNQFLNNTKREVLKKLGIAWIATIKIARQSELLAKMQEYSKKTLTDYYMEFGIGRRTLLDIINVKNDYNNARQSYESAKYDLLLSKFRILDAMGGLVDYFLAKADKMQLTLDKEQLEDKSVYEIIRQMGAKLRSGESLILKTDNNQSSLDALLNKSAEDELDFSE